MIANPAARFYPKDRGPKPYERRNVCVLPRSQADLVDHRAVMTKCSGGRHTHQTRTVIAALVKAGEMRWVDRHHNVATYATVGTWQKTRSGAVHTMQLIQGQRGRHMPAGQRSSSLPVVGSQFFPAAAATEEGA